MRVSQLKQTYTNIFLSIVALLGVSFILFLSPQQAAADTWSCSTTLKPSASLSSVPEDPDSIGEITLDGRGSFDPDGTIDEYRWYYDGAGEYGWWSNSPDNTTTLATDDHYYTETGTYEVGLVVEDSAGCLSRTTYTLAVGYDCQDGLDNDGDGDIDYPDDSGCTSETDQTENSPPNASDDNYQTLEGITLSITSESNGVLSNDSDPDGDAVSVTGVISQPTNGTVTMNADGTFEYTPDSGFVGDDTFTYEVSDNYGGSSEATVTIEVKEENDPPSATDDDYSTDEDNTLSVDPDGVLSNDSDPNTGDTITADRVIDSPNYGSVSLDSDGSFTYNPNTNYDGSDSFTYEISDSFGSTDTAVVSITVNAVNDAPTANRDEYSTQENETLSVDAPGVLGNDTDPDDSNLSASLISGAADGSVSLTADGAFEYTPSEGFVGTDSFEYEVSDDSGAADTAIVEITVNDATACNDNIDNDGDGAIDMNDDGCTSESDTTENSPPSASSNSYNTEEGSTLEVTESDGVLSDDSDPDGDPLQASVVSGPSSGTLNLNDNGSFTYTPDSGFTNTDSFEYQASDGLGGTDNAQVDITVSESPVCSDGEDNDGDGVADYQGGSGDPGCSSPSDNSENETPSITLEGDNPMTILKGGSYTEPGYTASDPEDGDITSQVSTSSPTGGVDTSTEGTYEILYEVTDSGGLTVQETRTVEVVSSDLRTGGTSDNGGSSSGSACDPSALPDDQVSYLTDNNRLCLFQESDVEVTADTIGGSNFLFLFLADADLSVNEQEGIIFRNRSDGNDIRDPRDDALYNNLGGLPSSVNESVTLENISTGEVIFGQFAEEHEEDGDNVADWIWFTGDSRNTMMQDGRDYNICDQPRGGTSRSICRISSGEVRVDSVRVSEVSPDIYNMKFVGREGTQFDVFNFTVEFTADPWQAAIITSDCTISGGGYTCEFEAQQAPGTTYTWDFGDGTTETVEDDPTVTHTYDSSTQQYTVTLTVESNQVTRSDSTTVGGEERDDNTDIGTSGSICGNPPQATDMTFPNPLGNNITGVCDFLTALFDAIMSLAVPLIILMILYSGFLFITARGDQQQLESAKSTFFWAIIGAAILLGAEVLAEAIVGTLSEF